MLSRQTLLLLSLGAALGCVSEAAAQRTSRVFLGYYAAISELPIEEIPWARLTHACHAFLAVDAEGQMVENPLVPSQTFTDAAHEHGVTPLLSLGGGKTAEGLTKLAESDDAIRAFAKKVVEAVVANNYDGVDIDWESPSDQRTMEGLVLLVKSLRSGLDQAAAKANRTKSYLLTAAVPPSNHLGKWFDVGAVASRLDWLNVMCYDMSGPWERTAGHHAPLFPSQKDPERGWRSVQAAMEYWRKERGVPKEKLLVGVPMYGRALPVSKVFEPLDPAKRKQHGALSFTRVRELVGQGWPAMWDYDAHAPWLRPKEQQDSPLLICYEDRNSVHDKAEWAAKEGYRGMFFWAIHQDKMPDGTHWLLRAANKAWPAGN
ncbi:Chitinase A1 precursor [Posidoniimonas polymericola]|uniref:chitinase n=1 Tax=Posidoniimonas polymericola TaxID=2528002 RepID=A0A5C5YT81_9BACT|nr:glycoside hydrolase family 18 protein [Posidoniimonas polymericola]TWT78189.1 Chitinase A1 precursor [Posidoniimonas polymericola]